MKYNRLINRASRLQQATPTIEVRGSGRTTARALSILAQAIEHPGEWIDVKDHPDVHNAADKYRNRWLGDKIIKLAEKLGLQYIERDRQIADVPRIRSNHFTDNPWEIA